MWRSGAQERGLPDGYLEPIKAVMFFFDRNHENGSTNMDDVDFYLQRSTNKVTWTTIDSDTSDWDEKARVFEDNVTSSSYYWRLLIVGVDVFSSSTGCGTQSIKTYYSWFYEDSDRDDSDGPGSDVEVE